MKIIDDEFAISELVILYIKDELSVKQKERLHAWLNDSEKNRDLFEKLKSKEHFIEKSKKDKKFEDPTRWIYISKEINKRKRKLRLRYGAIAASFFVPLLIGSYFFMQSEEVMKAPRTIIKPGKNEAVLITDNGEEINLSNNNFKLNTSGVIKIQNKNNVLSYEKEKAETVVEKMEYNTIVVPRGGEYQMVLADGTKVWLNSESELRFPVNFVEDTRTVWVKGEAFFEVAHDKEKPFFAMVNEKSIEVLGTEFNIKAYPEESEIITTLQSGSVKFNFEDKSQMLTPDHQIIYSEITGETELKEVNVQEVTAWVHGKFYFKSLNLEKIMVVLGRWYNFEMEFEDVEAKDLIFRGMIYRGMTFEDVVDIIKETTNVQIENYGNKITISLKEL